MQKFEQNYQKLLQLTKNTPKTRRGWTVGRKVGRGLSTLQAHYNKKERPSWGKGSVQPSNRPTFFLLNFKSIFITFYDIRLKCHNLINLKQ